MRIIGSPFPAVVQLQKYVCFDEQQRAATITMSPAVTQHLALLYVRKDQHLHDRERFESRRGEYCDPQT